MLVHTDLNDADLVQYYDELIDYISAKIGNAQLAHDVVQETYLRIFQRPEQFLNLVQPNAFLKKVSMNIAFDFLKKDKTYQHYFLSLDDPDLQGLEQEQVRVQFSEPELQVARTQYTQQILASISDLPPVCQDIFLLIQFYGMTQVDVAQQLGLSRTMVIKHFSRALQHFSPLFAHEPI